MGSRYAEAEERGSVHVPPPERMESGEGEGEQVLPWAFRADLCVSMKLQQPSEMFSNFSPKTRCLQFERSFIPAGRVVVPCP